MLRMITYQQETLFFFAVGDIFRTEELALLAPHVMLPLCSIPTVGLVSFGHWLLHMSNLVFSLQGRLWPCHGRGAIASAIFGRL